MEYLKRIGSVNFVLKDSVYREMTPGTRLEKLNVLKLEMAKETKKHQKAVWRTFIPFCCVFKMKTLSVPKAKVALRSTTKHIYV